MPDAFTRCYVPVASRPLGGVTLLVVSNLLISFDVALCLASCI